MKKRYITIISLILSCLLSVSVLSVTAGCAVNRLITSDAKLFINDELQQFTLYRNPDFFFSDIEEYVPLQACMEALGCTFEKNGFTSIVITTSDGRVINMQIEGNKINYTGGLRNVSRVPMEYFKIGGVIYYPLYEFSELLDCDVLFDGNDLYLDTGEHLIREHGYDNIGRKVNISVFVNDIKIGTLVYRNRKSPSVQGPDNLSDYVQLKPVLEVLGIDLSETENWHYFDNPVVIDNEQYVPFSSIRYNINGSLVQDDYTSMYLYSSGFDRKDIPATPEEAYKALDKLLSSEEKEYIKNLDEDDLISLHFGLGLWIRNNWLYPANSKLADLLYEAGLHHPDDMSGFLILGYYHYLNGRDYTLDMHMQKMRNGQ